MLTSKEIKQCRRDDHPRRENLATQPLVEQRVFNNNSLLTVGWYPLCKSSTLKKTSARSFNILNQRVAVFRSQSGKLCALDSFCPHLGADLGNGEVIGENLRCFYHHWSFNQEGKLSKLPCEKAGQAIKETRLNTYPVCEKYGFIWVYSDFEEKHTLPNPPQLLGPTKAIHLKKVKLFAHHHVMMTNAIDLQHFKSVHSLDIDFDFKVSQLNQDVFSWSLEGEIPQTSLKLKLAHYLLGGKFRYEALFAGGSVTSITYGVNQRFRGTGFKIPSVHILWGATPLKEGVSAVDIFFVVAQSTGFFGPIKTMVMYLLSFILLFFLNDDDIKAFPHMRYNIGKLTEQDQSLAKFIQLTNKLSISPWSARE